ncbi:MAG: hypothetical protein K9W43_01960 [Candidatus Thorarchaeota archaeon]|nr:hypothetical protein [Candidatus Thorarchaeota archaeon]
MSIGKRTVDICPKCRSTRLIPIEEKRRELAQELRHTIMMLQYGHSKLREFVRNLTDARQTLVSLRMAKFLHYKWLEEQIEAIQDELPALKNRIVKQAEIVARQMAAETKGLMDYPSWTAQEFPFITGVTNRMTELGTQYRRHVDDTLEEVNKKLRDLRKHIEGLDYYKRQFAGFGELVELDVGELPVCAFPEIRVTGSDFLKHDKASGTLYVTNRRLIFIATTGTFRKKTEVIFQFPLLYLNGFEEDGRFRKRLVLKFKQGVLKISCSEQTQRVLPDYIEIARKFDRYIQTDMQRVRKIQACDVNASDARLRIDELVYQLLSNNHYSTPQPELRSPPRRYSSDWSRPQTDHQYSPSMSPRYDSFRDELEDIIGRANTWRYGPATAPQDAEAIHMNQTIRDIENDIRETVQLLRTGMIVPSDFVRRYRSLMREQYKIRRLHNHYEDRRRSFRW